MKKLPDEKKLIELLELAKEAEEKAKEMFEMATIMALKCQMKDEKRRAAKETADNIE